MVFNNENIVSITLLTCLNSFLWWCILVFFLCLYVICFFVFRPNIIKYIDRKGNTKLILIQFYVFSSHVKGQCEGIDDLMYVCINAFKFIIRDGMDTIDVDV